MWLEDPGHLDCRLGDSDRVRARVWHVQHFFRAWRAAKDRPGDPHNERAASCILSYYAGPLALAPGESVTDSVLVRSAGTFRLFVGYGRGEQRILYQARSGAFRVD